ncbi:MAG TPA: Ig-like domain repeat protein [Candidatus Polarisedimenticolia bacterium]|nr:Ig-like domain repeat protein [Candidatus Polarisedimenticolia bacterium]
MKLQSSIFRNSLFVVTLILALPAFRAAAQTKPASTSAAQAAAIPASITQARITQAIDETQLVRLRGNVHPLARPEFDRGPVSDATPMDRMLLLLQHGPDQEAALRQFMDEQQMKDSPNFQKWLTPQEFARLYGPADADIQTITDWLTRQGFHNVRVGAGRTVLEFSGNVGQVRNAFHTEIHRFNVNGEARQANVTDPQIPAALTPVVAGIVSLHNFPTKSMRHTVGAFTRNADGTVTPQFTGSTNQFFAVGPADFAKIYNIPSSLDGTGGNIAIIGFSSIDVNDARAFRTLFGLPANDPIIVNNGPDPGINGEEGEADLDVQWSGAVAPKATIHYINSEGTLTSDPLFLGAEYVVDNNSDDVMSLSFGVCEAGLGATTNAFINTLWEQAAAQGITITVSAGDNGGAGCDDFNTAVAATSGLAVNGIASTPFNIAVGGTDFDDVGNQAAFWNQNPGANDPVTRLSAMGYIHEVPWNDSCGATATSSTLNTVCALQTGDPLLNIVAASGGPSAVYPKPSWQNGLTPADSHRDLPDVSLFASDGPSSKSFYVVCEADALPPGSNPSCASSGPFGFLGVGGTSASAPSFAGIIALIGQSEFNASRSRRQGNANLVLYKIAATAANSCNSSTTPLTGSTTCAFYDVTKGNNSVPCAANSPAGTSPNCSSTTAGTNGVLVSPASPTTPAWTTATGYDLATGLGSVNVANLATQWPLALGSFKGTTSTLLINNSATPAAITHGTAVTAKVSVAVTAPATGTPTGDVSVVAPTTVGGGNNGGTLSGGTVTINGVILPGGTYPATAHYAGDGTFAPSDSVGVPITVNKENSRLQVGIVTFDIVTGNITSTNATSVAYGSPYILRMDILNSTTSACQPLATGGVTTGCAFDATGTVTFTDSVSGPPPSTGAGTFTINSEGHAENQPIQLTGGTHALSATYSGDISYNPVTTAVTDTVMVSPATTATALSPGASTVQANQGITLSVTISSASNSTVGPTMNVTFKDGATTIGTAAAVPAGATATAGASATAVLNTSFATTGVHTLTAVYAGDTNYGTSTSAGVTVKVGLVTTTSVTSSVTSIASGGSVTLTATVATTSHGAGPTGTVQFQNGISALSAAATCTPTAGTATATAFCTATLTTTLAFLAPPLAPHRMPNIRFHPVVLVAFLLLLLFLFSLRHIPAAYRRGYACAALLLLAVLVAGLGGCGSYGGGGPAAHYDSITAVYGGDATYAGSTSSAITITVQ